MTGRRSIEGDRRFLSEAMQQMRLSPLGGVIQFVIGDSIPEPRARCDSAYTGYRAYAAEPWMKLTAALLLLEDLADHMQSGEDIGPDLQAVREQVFIALAAFGLEPKSPETAPTRKRRGRSAQ